MPVSFKLVLSFYLLPRRDGGAVTLQSQWGGGHARHESSDYFSDILGVGRGRRRGKEFETFPQTISPSLILHWIGR